MKLQNIIELMFVNIRIETVLLMANFRSHMVMKRKMNIPVGIKSLDINFYSKCLSIYCREIGIVVNLQQFEGYIR